jgi:hypothetical protein
VCCGAVLCVAPDVIARCYICARRRSVGGWLSWLVRWQQHSSAVKPQAAAAAAQHAQQQQLRVARQGASAALSTPSRYGRVQQREEQNS